MTTYTLTNNVDNFVGGLGDDTFAGTYNDGATGTWGILDSLDGGAGFDTLSVTPIGTAAITPNDSYWSHISHIEKVVINTTGPGAQTLTTGAFFEAAFAGGVALDTSSGAGAITVDMSSFTGAATLTTTSTGGAQAIVMGMGPATVMATSDAGALTISGVGLTSVQATTTGAGAQTIGDSSGGGAQLVMVTAADIGGAQTITSTSTNAVKVIATSTAGVQTISTGAGADVINAATTAAINTISTGAGNDTVNISATATGGYTINAGIGDDFVNGGAGNDAINGGDGNDKVRGGAGNDTLTGGLGDDTLNGGAGADTMTGGDGSDNYNVDNAGDIVIETNANIGTGGVDIVNSSINAYTLTANVETGRVLAAGAANMTGNGLANLLYAGAGDNVLDGGLGVDTTSYLYAASAVTVSLAVAGSQNTLGSGSDTLIGIENLNGGNYNDTLTGNAGANVLNGDAGADTMTGGDGADTYYVDNIGDVVTETNAASTGGIDTVYSSLNAYTLTANVETGRVLLAGAANMTGNSLANLLYAGAGDNVLDGGLGVDTVSYLYAASAVTVSLAVAGSQNTLGSGSDTLIGIENLNGGNYNDTLTGNAGANALSGGLGADTLVGGDGSDSYTVDNVGDVVTETNAANAGGIDTVNSSLNAYTLTANVENGQLLSSGAANMTGNSLNNLLYAGAGNNVLDGGLGVDTVSYLYAASAVTVSLAVAGSQNTLGSGSDTLIGIEKLNGSNYNDTLTGNAGANDLNGSGGADTMAGGNGSDYYYVDNASDVVTETNAASTGGIDTVFSYLNAYTLTANVENGRTLSAGAANMTGNSLDNLLYAGAGDNVLDGDLGVDTVSYLYAASAVTVSLAAAGSQNTLGSGSDTLIGIENLTGSNYNDTLTGDAGANILLGGLGFDTLTGGGGNDIFDFNALSEMGTLSGATDVITDFVSGQDKIDLSTLDANTATVANNAFSSFIDNTASFTAAGQLMFLDGVLYGNTNTDSSAEFAIQLTGVTTLAISDIIL